MTALYDVEYTSYDIAKQCTREFQFGHTDTQNDPKDHPSTVRNSYPVKLRSSCMKVDK